MKTLAALLTLVLLSAGCSSSQPPGQTGSDGVSVRARDSADGDRVDIQAGSDGVSVRARDGADGDRVDIQTGSDGVSVRARDGADGDRVDIQTGSDEVSVRARREGARVQVGQDGVQVQGGSARVQTGPGGLRIDAGGTSVNLGEGSLGVNVPGANVNLGVGVDVPGVGVNIDSPGGVQVAVEGTNVLVDTDLVAIELPEIDVPGVVVKEGPEKVVYAVSGDVLFDFDSADIRPKAEQALAQIAGSLNERYPGKKVRIEGHTDDKGSDSYNLKLSKRRAEAVRDWLESEGGWDSDQARVVGLGETHPVAQNKRADGSDDPAGRQRNRRVEIVVVK